MRLWRAERGAGFPGDVCARAESAHARGALAPRTRVALHPVRRGRRGGAEKRDPKAPPLNLVYLDHCGAVKQREQQLWDVFSRHSVADGGVLAVTFPPGGNAWDGARPPR